ncbi:DUF2063 domain-containing protein [Sandaracinobacter neustonicus]|uniref:DUF2063 domain-containing protein n=1 Tax=Sandaracinobacter neustonicus TaxID=1715348 RepID=A0A501XCY9_9SPHN|nr:putative DNA-binding domain-containing protein [Sandaracinobacter neustonicus]TPE58440.1 DUF2063 domain-containing protein [Sandaracinobacter neustonicus]
MRLIEMQRGFLGTVSSAGEPDDGGWPPSMHAGLQVYRNAYRARLIGCLQESFPKCRAWAGDAAFDAAASHHCIRQPPTSWTLDALGAGFDATLAELFPDNPELAELCWLEWQMARLFTAPDGARLDAGSFTEATARFSERDWEEMRLVIAPELVTRPLFYDVTPMWTAIGADIPPLPNARLPVPGTVAVWRAGLEPCFRLLPDDEGAALADAANGVAFGEICRRHAESVEHEGAAARCGQWLGRWTMDGLIAGLR